MKFIIIFVMLLLMPTAYAQVTDFTVIEPFPETVVAGNHVNATVSFVSDSEPFNVTLTFTSPTFCRCDCYELADSYIILDNTIRNNTYLVTMTQDTVIIIYDNIISTGFHTVTAGFILNPAIQPDDYTFDLIVSWQEDVAGLVTATKTKSTRVYSGNHQIIEKEEPTTHFKENWSPYDDENGKGEIDLNGAGGGGYVYGNITDEGEEPDDIFKDIEIMFKWIFIILFATMVVSVLNVIAIHEERKKHETEQEHA